MSVTFLSSQAVARSAVDRSKRVAEVDQIECFAQINDKGVLALAHKESRPGVGHPGMFTL